MKAVMFLVAITFALALSAPAFTCAAGGLSQASVIDWNELVDQEAQDFDDPYRDLEPDQLIRLITVARLRERADKGGTIDAEELHRETASLAADGIDVDGLIAQRWVVAERRKRAATSGNRAVDGREVMLSGFVIPAPAVSDGMATAYLVPERGMCSHTPPPPPNQMVRLRLPDDWQPREIYEPARFSGRLEIAPSSRTVRVVDGMVSMRTTFTMDVSRIETLASSQLDRASPTPLDGSPAARLSATSNGRCLDDSDTERSRGRMNLCADE